MSIETPWMDIAQKEVGVEEPDKRILDYFKDTDYPDPTVRTAYCAAFVNYCLDEAGYKGSGHANAISFATWGKEVPVGTLGAIGVFKWLDGTHHVAFYNGNGQFLGGNQTREHEVCIESLPLNRIIAWRWPNIET